MVLKIDYYTHMTS